MAAIDISSPASGGGGGGGNLQLSGGASMTSTLTSVTDTSNTSSPLKLSTTAVQVLSPLRITTSDASGFYLDAEDSATNNRFSIKRDPSSQLVTLDFASNPAGSTTSVGAIRTYVDGVNLSEVMEFREDGNVKVGGILSVGNYVNSTGFGQKIRVIGQGDASVGIYRNQASAFGAKLEFMKSRGTYDAPVVVNAGDLLGNVGYFGYNGTSYSTSAGISSGVLSTTATGVEADVRFILYNNTGGNFNTMRLTKEGVGIGNALDYIPSATLQLRGSGSTSATTSLLVQNSSATDLFKVQDDGVTTISSVLSVTSYISAGDYITTNGIVIGNGNSRLYAFNGANANLSINNTGIVASTSGYSSSTASAVLEANSTTQGFLPPRMTDAQRAAIASPAEGLLVYNTDNHAVAYRDGTNWGYLCGALQNQTGSGGTLAISFASGNIVNLTLNASTTLTFAGHVVGTYIIQVTQGGAGSNTLTYPASVKWSGGTAPTLTTTVGKTDILTFYHDGTSFFGTYSLNY